MAMGREVAAFLAIAALGAGCASQRAAEAQHEEYADLVQLRGTTITMLESHRISVDEARMVKVMLDAARRAADGGQSGMAQTELDAVREYLKARQGQPL